VLVLILWLWSEGSAGSRGLALWSHSSFTPGVHQIRIMIVPLIVQFEAIGVQVHPVKVDGR
jgi:hypothetical protein